MASCIVAHFVVVAGLLVTEAAYDPLERQDVGIGFLQVADLQESCHRKRPVRQKAIDRREDLLHTEQRLERRLFRIALTPLQPRWFRVGFHLADHVGERVFLVDHA